MAEVLYRASIDPYASLAELDPTQQEQLAIQILSVAQESYYSQRSTESPFLDDDEETTTAKTSATTTSTTTQTPTTHPHFEYQCYGQKTCPQGYPVLCHPNGPHGRTIWFTAQQLVRPLQERAHYRLFHADDNNDNNGIVVVSSSPERATATTKVGMKPPQQLENHEELVRHKAQQQQQNKEEKNRANQRRPMAHSRIPMAQRPSPIVGKKRPYLQESMANERTVQRPPASTEDNSNGSKRVDWNDVTSTKDNTAMDLSRGLLDKQWRAALSGYMETSESFQNLAQFLRREQEKGCTIYPPTNQEIFGALNACPLGRVRVVLLGQDPYHGPNQAHGLAFSVRHEVRPLPPSLRNIFKELQDEGLLSASADRAHGNLQKWANQGVLLLNTVLTVRQGEANSHKGKGWEEFTDEVIKAVLMSHTTLPSADDQVDNTNDVRHDNDDDLAITSTDQCPPQQRCIFLLWGNPAAEKVNGVIDPSQHVIIRSSHPSPLSASRTQTPFFGSNCFRRVNKALEEMGEEPIDWNVN